MLLSLSSFIVLLWCYLVLQHFQIVICKVEVGSAVIFSNGICVGGNYLTNVVLVLLYA